MTTAAQQSRWLTPIKQQFEHHGWREGEEWYLSRDYDQPFEQSAIYITPTDPDARFGTLAELAHMTKDEFTVRLVECNIGVDALRAHIQQALKHIDDALAWAPIQSVASEHMRLARRALIDPQSEEEEEEKEA